MPGLEQIVQSNSSLTSSESDSNYSLEPLVSSRDSTDTDMQAAKEHPKTYDTEESIVEVERIDRFTYEDPTLLQEGEIYIFFLFERCFV